jgi:hypothetical protein
MFNVSNSPGLEEAPLLWCCEVYIGCELVRVNARVSSFPPSFRCRCLPTPAAVRGLESSTRVRFEAACYRARLCIVQITALWWGRNCFKLRGDGCRSASTAVVCENTDAVLNTTWCVLVVSS